MSITNGIVSSKIYDKRDGFNFELVNFPFLDGYVPRSPYYVVYIAQLICFARVCSNAEDFNNRNLFFNKVIDIIKFEISKDAKIRNRYNQVPHLTQDTNGKATNSQLDTTNESQEVSHFPAGDH